MLCPLTRTWPVGFVHIYTNAPCQISTTPFALLRLMLDYKSLHSRFSEALPHQPEIGEGNCIDGLGTPVTKWRSQLNPISSHRRASSLNKVVNRTRKLLCAPARPVGMIDKKSVTIRVISDVAISPNPDCEPSTERLRVVIEENTWWSGGLLAGLLPDIHSLTLLQGFPPSFLFDFKPYPKLSFLKFQSPSSELTYDLEDAFLKLLRNCSSLRGLALSYQNPTPGG